MLKHPIKKKPLFSHFQENKLTFACDVNTFNQLIFKLCLYRFIHYSKEASGKKIAITFY